MTTQYVYAPRIVDEAKDCSLNLFLQSFSGPELCIPFGKAAKKLKSQDLAADQKPTFVTVTPLVFKDYTLDKSKAGAPDFIPMDKFRPLPEENAAYGYYYIYINGFLWREIAALADKQLSDVDLSLYHSQDFRPHTSVFNQDILLPRKIIGLFGSAAAAQAPDVQIAFSRVQWSWEYITALGGMYESDSRLSKKPLLSKCDDTQTASRYRTKRMQSLDLNNAPNWGSIKNMDVLGGKVNVFIHDVLGIAQAQKVTADYYAKILKDKQSKLESNGYYKSAMLAHQLYFNDELWQRQALSTPKSMYKPHEKNDNQSSNTRKAAEEVSERELEKYLIGTNPTSVTDAVEGYLDAREKLYDLYYLDCQAQQLTLHEISQQINIDPPAEWEDLVKDFTTAGVLSYGLAAEFICEQLITLILPKTTLSAYLPALCDKAKKKKLIDRLDQQFEDNKALVLEITQTRDNWFSKQFCVHPDAYGDNLVNADYDEDLIANTVEGFNPKKFEHDKIKEELSLPFIPAYLSNKSVLDVVSKGLNEWLGLQERVFSTFGKELTEKGIKYHHLIGGFSKSRNIAQFKNLQIHPANAVPEGRFALNMDIVSHPLLNDLKTKKQRSAFRNIIKAIEEKGKITSTNTNQVITVAKALKQPLFANGINASNQRLFKQTIALVTQMAKMVLEQKTLAALMSGSQSYVLTLPENDIPAKVLFDSPARSLGDEFHYRGLDKIMLKRITLSAGRFVSIPLLFLTGYSSYVAYGDYEKEFKKGTPYEISKNIALLGGTLAAIGSVWEAYAKNIGERYLTKTRLSFKAFGSTSSLNILRGFSGAMGILMGVIQAVDGYQLISKSDTDAGIAMFAAAGFSIGLGIHTILFASLGPWGWALLLGSIVFSLLAVWLTDSKLEIWAKFGPFAKNKRGVFAGEEDAIYNTFSDPNQYFKYIQSVLFSPKVTINEPSFFQSTSYYTVKVELSMFIVGKSELLLDVKYSWRHPTTLNVYKKATWVEGTKEYLAEFDENSLSLNAATYEFEIESPNISVFDVEITSTLIYNESLTLPIDFDAFEKPIENASLELAIA
ncbi:hypothetical protein HH219_12455 [Pseudoalteromonas sp. NEC-BIFX-2020_015]|uniref:hypothetical protein n=1 Tax=Pseudoalteromonas sp. NEC-BIFX-2020_015 TaxID=2729544 RepID=UPI0014615E3F|nr:hypothetical protein [Pseudoalteromonas sp. NEC-BIFX-2020_015]NMR26334.1 hypothetical protein [Pseudoalteromonas sp. NEC-BIFX-2020_015]